jgi:acyl-CoA oxidase
MVTGASWLMLKVGLERTFRLFGLFLTFLSAATVSIRYASVRRQGEIDVNGLEKQIIQYPSVYIRLLPIRSHAYALTQLGQTLVCSDPNFISLRAYVQFWQLKSSNTMSTRLASGDTSLLAEMHATTSGLKAIVSSLGA